MQRRDVRLPRFRVIRRARLVRHVGRVVLVGQTGEVMAELVDEHVLGEPRVGGRGRLEVEDSAAAVLRLVDQDLEKLVGRRGRRVAQRAVVVGEQIAFGIEDVVLRRQRRPTDLESSRPADAGAGRRQIEPPHVEVRAATPERLLLEQGADQPPGVGMELGQLRLDVPFADHEQVDLLRRRTALLNGPDLAHGRPIGRIDEPGLGIDHRRPDLVEAVLGVAHLQHDLHRPPRPGKPQRLVERPVHAPRLRRRLPLAVDRREPARVDRPVGPPVDHLEEVLAEVEIVDEPRAAAGPRAVRYDPIQTEDLRSPSAGVEVVDAHRLVDEVGVETLPAGGPALPGGAEPRTVAQGAGRDEQDADDAPGDGCSHGRYSNR